MILILEAKTTPWGLLIDVSATVLILYRKVYSKFVWTWRKSYSANFTVCGLKPNVCKTNALKEAFFLIPSKTLIESEKASCTSCRQKQPLTSMFAINFGLKAAFQLSWSPLSFLLVCYRLSPSQHTICDVMWCWLTESAGADSFRQKMCSDYLRRRPWGAAT